jgi:hypothetical protein
VITARGIVAPSSKEIFDGRRNVVVAGAVEYSA